METRGVVLKPTIIEKTGAHSNISSFDEASMEQLNTKERNDIVKNALLEGVDDYKKIIIYVGSKAHAKDLCQHLKESELIESYDSISYVLGGDGNNSRSQSRKGFFEQEKQYERSIVVNVQVMTEGYDDPTVNTVVMAAPTKSKLTYMQCMGRAIRRNPKDPDKKAFVVELVDELPNIKYRIDNRWIYSEISDVLEPQVIDREYWDAESFKQCLENLYDEYAVCATRREYPEFDPKERYQILFFKQYKRSEGISHIPLILTRENRREIQNWFNFLSVRFALKKFKEVNREQVMGSVRKWWGAYLADQETRLAAHAAMENSLTEEDFILEHAPWISFACLRKVVRENNNDLDEFLEDVLNRDEIKENLTTLDHNPYGLIKFPLPLGGSLVRIADREQIGEVENLISQIKKIDNLNDSQFEELSKILANSGFSFESKFLNSLSSIVKNNLTFIYKFI